MNIGLRTGMLVRQHNLITDFCRAPRSKKWNFRTKFLVNFRTI